MTQVNFKRVASLPYSLDSGTFYFVEAGDYAESYLTSSTGQAKAIGNSAMINALVTAQLQNLSVNTVEVAADIAARDALIAGATTNLLIIVLDATADTSVASGAALYVYEKDADAVHKIAEYESMDFDLSWSALTGKPTSAVADIDEAVTQRHAHNNKTALDQIGADGSTLTFQGNPVSGASDWAQEDW